MHATRGFTSWRLVMSLGDDDAYGRVVAAWRMELAQWRQRHESVVSASALPFKPPPSVPQWRPRFEHRDRNVKAFRSALQAEVEAERTQHVAMYTQALTISRRERKKLHERRARAARSAQAQVGSTLRTFAVRCLVCLTALGFLAS